MSKYNQSCHTQIILLTLFLIAIAATSTPPASAYTTITPDTTQQSQYQPPSSIILIIMDGTGAPYYSGNAHTIDGGKVPTITHTPMPPTTNPIIETTAFVPQTTTGPGHSVIATGYSKADTETVGFEDATLYDAARKAGWLTIAVMEKGDAGNFRNEQDAILFAESNSINNPSMSIEIHPHSQDNDDNNNYNDATDTIAGISQIMNSWQKKPTDYIAPTKKATVERYSAYNAWALDASSAIIEYMETNHPDTRYILTINVGANDAAGHYLGTQRYTQVVDQTNKNINTFIDKIDTMPGMSIAITADHGMGFETVESKKGGHGSDKYTVMDEVQNVPFIIISSDETQLASQTNTATHTQPIGQEDIAPTIISLMDAPPILRYTDGTSIQVKPYINIFVDCTSTCEAKIENKGKIIASANDDDEYLFTELEPETTYTITATINRKEEIKTIITDHDTMVEFGTASKQTNSPNEDAKTAYGKMPYIL
ncbi:MAG: sulfatase-like hydrolase/transferase, partial [Methanosarcinales archaeon]|nr:sulfatase-like hydrolase/transferase [Methanosarcinales archaeon]